MSVVRHRRPVPFVGAAAVVAFVGCASGTVDVTARTTSTATILPTPSSAATPNHVPPVPDGWAADEVAVATVMGTIAGTWTHPRSSSSRSPAALIIGGSGPTDRDGNSAGSSAVVDNLKTVANWLAADGVATLRTDKPGS